VLKSSKDILRSKEEESDVSTAIRFIVSIRDAIHGLRVRIATLHDHFLADKAAVQAH
jgi:hypothetical protein